MSLCAFPSSGNYTMATFAFFSKCYQQHFSSILTAALATPCIKMEERHRLSGRAELQLAGLSTGTARLLQCKLRNLPSVKRRRALRCLCACRLRLPNRIDDMAINKSQLKRHFGRTL